MADLSAFSESYAEARGKFLDTARACGARLAHYRNWAAQGPAGEHLYLDVAVIGPPQAPNVLVAGCGTHGIEGFSGSAALTNWLRTRGAGLPPDAAVVFLHAHNPWGFAWKTRTTEENVDLNRNFIDFSKPPPRNEGYEEVHSIVAFPEWTEAKLSETFQRLSAFRERVGEKAFSDAFNGGQYAHADGIYYGGKRPQWANGAFRQAVGEHLVHARRIAFIDLHTGIGPRYEHIYLCFHEPGSRGYESARAWWGERAVNRQGVTHKALATYSGTIIDAVVEMLPQTEVTSIVVEFGTLPREGVQRAGIAQRWLRFEGAKHPELATRVQREYEEAFYPSEPRWRECALAQSLEFLDRGVRGVASG
jgi:hypothetical protein